MKELLQAGHSGRVSAPPEKRFLIRTLDGSLLRREFALHPRGACSALVPSGLLYLSAGHQKKAHSSVLPIEYDVCVPLTSGNTSTIYALSPAAGKLALLIMAGGKAQREGAMSTTLRALVKTINPNALLRRTHYETVLAALGELDSVRVLLPKGMSYRMFECPVPWREITPAEYDERVVVGLTGPFRETLEHIRTRAGRNYRGEFLINIAGAMALPTKRGSLLRQYVRLCAYWNSAWKPGTGGTPDPDRLPEIQTEKWAVMCNCLSPSAAAYLLSKQSGCRSRLSHESKAVLDELKLLHDLELVNLKYANRRVFKCVPPPDYMAAWHELRKPRVSAGKGQQVKNPRNKSKNTPQQK